MDYCAVVSNCRAWNRIGNRFMTHNPYCMILHHLGCIQHIYTFQSVQETVKSNACKDQGYHATIAKMSWWCNDIFSQGIIWRVYNSYYVNCQPPYYYLCQFWFDLAFVLLDIHCTLIYALLYIYIIYLYKTLFFSYQSSQISPAINPSCYLPLFSLYSLKLQFAVSVHVQKV